MSDNLQAVALNQVNCGKAVRTRFLTLMCGVGAFCIATPAIAQTRDREKDRDRKEEPSAQQLETRVTKAEAALLSEYMEIANEYYKQGDKESSIEVLRRIERIDPKQAGVKQRIDAIEEELLQENGLKTELDVSKGWIQICDVEEGKPFRLAAVGEYKLEYSATVPLTGLSSADPAKDHVSAGPFGALIGVVVTDGKPGEPFVVNGGLEQTPKKSGQLFLRVNVPAIAKCKGEIKIQLSGAIKSAVKRK